MSCEAELKFTTGLEDGSNQYGLTIDLDAIANASTKAGDATAAYRDSSRLLRAPKLCRGQDAVEERGLAAAASQVAWLVAACANAEGLGRRGGPGYFCSVVGG